MGNVKFNNFIKSVGELDYFNPYSTHVHPNFIYDANPLAADSKSFQLNKLFESIPGGTIVKVKVLVYDDLTDGVPARFVGEIIIGPKQGTWDIFYVTNWREL